MGEEKLNLIKDTIEIIEANIKQLTDLDQLSGEIGLSKYHLHRLFRSITGKSLMNYVRKRKLSLSLHELLYTDLKVIDIASEYKFEYEQSYIRAFKQMFLMTPSQYRKHHCQLIIEQKIDTNSLEDIGQGILVRPYMVMEPKFYVQGLQAEIVHSENYLKKTTNQLAETFFRDYHSKVPNRVNENTYIGLVRYRDNQEYSNDYVACVETKVINPIQKPFVQYTIPTAEYAVFRYIGLHNPHEISMQTLCDLYQYIDNWMIDTAYTHPYPYHYEKMNLLVCSDDYCEMDIYMPIASKP